MIVITPFQFYSRSSSLASLAILAIVFAAFQFYSRSSKLKYP